MLQFWTSSEYNALNNRASLGSDIDCNYTTITNQTSEDQRQSDQTATAKTINDWLWQNKQINLDLKTSIKYIHYRSPGFTIKFRNQFKITPE